MWPLVQKENSSPIVFDTDEKVGGVGQQLRGHLGLVGGVGGVNRSWEGWVGDVSGGWE